MRSFIPFGNPWQISISTPYSFLVKDRDLAWTCGQIPVDMNSKVRAPNDLVRQTNIVCDYIETIFHNSDLSIETLGKLVLYYVEQEAGDMEKMIECCRTRFGARVVLVPVAVPYFYFDGLLLEVDAFAGEINHRHFETTSGRSNVQFCDGGEISWICIKTDPEEIPQAQILLEEVLAAYGISSDQRLSEHWVAPNQNGEADSLPYIVEKLHSHNLISDAGALVESADNRSVLIGELTYVTQANSKAEIYMLDVDGIYIVKRELGRFYWFNIRSTNAQLSIVSQTKNIMNRLAKALQDEGLDFETIVKSTTYYTGGNSDNELFENMTVRNNHYTIPGPASTGLPVAGFAQKESLIVVDVIALSTSADEDVHEQ